MVPGVARVLLVRHGENPANLTKEFSHRRVDYSLTPKGRLQAQQTAHFLATRPIAAVWSSPLKRAQETAAPLARALGLTVQVCEDFREMNVGDLEGMEPRDRAWSVYADVMRQWFSGHPEARFPGGESRLELVERFRRGLETVAPSGEVVVVGHGGIFTHGVCELCALEDPKAFFAQENYNASVSLLEASGRSGWRLVSWGSTAHLSGEAAVLVESVPDSVRIANLKV